ncbi:MAG: trypsin-like peptidase domain-containing protein, partial [Kovacikia sp.]
MQADLKQKISIYSKPAVVRVVAGCYGTYSYSKNEFSANEISLTVGALGSGYFVDSNGSIVTSSHMLVAAEESGCKEQLFRRLVGVVTGQGNFDKISEEVKSSLRQHSQIKGDISYLNRVVLPTGASLPFEIKQSGSLVGGKPGDVAVIKIDVSNAPTVQLEESGKLAPQASMVILGYPLDQSVKSLSSSLSEDLSSLSFLKEVALGKSLGAVTLLDGWAVKSTPNSDSNSESNLAVLQFNEVLPLEMTGSPVLNDKGEVLG